ncbi:unnamed protein product [Callosobruchus maculatus]|uniref:Attacin C-terminal domain-containing protein n=1 Tax=Callosobruchus maculatus TaxID=64391 RepID=A0A653BDY5_CALMS|nr:unnamed protein product [Callosobruchus maculatus]
MKHIIIIGLCFMVVNGMPYEIAEDEEGQEYYMVPLSRARRSPDTETSICVKEKSSGVAHSGNIFDKNGHRLDGSAYANKDHHSPGIKPDQFGGQWNYNHDPSRTSAFVGADHTKGYGTDAGAGIKHDIHRSKDFNVGVGVGAQKHYGGPGGDTRPQFGAFVRGSGRF